jgi:hypothetical protein
MSGWRRAKIEPRDDITDVLRTLRSDLKRMRDDPGNGGDLRIYITKTGRSEEIRYLYFSQGLGVYAFGWGAEPSEDPPADAEPLF